MNPQDQIEQLKRQIERLEKALGEKQQLPATISPPSLIEDHEFVLAMARYSEGLEGFSEKEVRRRWNFTQAEWTALGSDDRLVERIRETKAARVKSGAAKRERAQQHVVAAVDVVNGIVTDQKANARHRIDGAKLLESMAGFSPENTADEEKVFVTINLNGDVHRFGGTVRPTPASGEIIDSEPSPIPGFMIPPAKDDVGGNNPI
jgi:hypothetical protein